MATFSGGDLTCDLCLFAVPREWRQPPVLNQSVSGAELAAYAPSLVPRRGELANELEMCPAVTVKAMPWGGDQSRASCSTCVGGC